MGYYKNYEDLKCGNPGDTDRLFMKLGPDATLEICETECLRVDACVAFSIVANEWCIACSAELTEPHLGAVGFKKGGKYLY